MTTKTIGSYIVRIWLEPTLGSHGAWRASATDTVTKEKHHFSNHEDLARFLAKDFHGVLSDAFSAEEQEG